MSPAIQVITGYDIRMLVALAVALSAFSAQQNLLPYVIHEADKISNAEFAARREKLIAGLPADSVAVVFTNPTQFRSNDTDFRFRPNSNFWYLTGCEEPDSAMLMCNSGISVDGRTFKSVLFVNDRNPGAETWTGMRLGPKLAEELLGHAKAVSNSRFKEILEGTGKPGFVRASIPEGATGMVGKMAAIWTEWAKGRQQTGRNLDQLNMMRSVKSADEIRLIKRACDSTVAAHIEAIKSCEPKMREFEIQALVEYVFARNGCEAVAYGSIVGSGMNSCVLHYMDNRKLINDGDMLCMDVGGEYHGYASDVTRSYPANGKFSAEQRAVYNLVLAAQEAGIRECKVGANFNAAHQTAMKIISEGLVKLGITKSASEAGRYFMHGTSHPVGLDVHDPFGSRTLEVNNVMTVEPGIYIQPGSPCDKKWWNIGVRIEDTLVVTANGPLNLSAGAPKTIEALEALMKETGLGNDLRGKIPPVKITRLEHHHDDHVGSR